MLLQPVVVVDFEVVLVVAADVVVDEAVDAVEALTRTLTRNGSP
jgi:hypothetical protein